MKATLIIIGFIASLGSLNAQMQRQDSTVGQVDVGLNTLQHYVGNYALRQDRIIKILLEEGKLYLKAPNQEKKVYFLPKSRNRFYNQLNSAEITFNRDQAGQVISMTIDNGKGRTMTATKSQTHGK